MEFFTNQMEYEKENVKCTFIVFLSVKRKIIEKRRGI